ncbi:MAG: hypothetical protein KBF82_06080 [Chitinophagaceae bacterium]|nr:hypothetical protein [Chitinophagaceae bacterium]MBP9103414.1 hypothetical protein [Chitinophagaceae bacterium]
MISKMRNNFLKTVMGLFILSFVFVACNNEGEKKEDTTPADTTVTVTPETTPAPAIDTTMKVDTADTRPVKPTE